MMTQKYGRSKLHRVFHSVATSSMKNTVRAMTGYGKIVIGFYQILSTLPVTFHHLDWTSSNDDIMDGSQVSRLDILSLPSMACLMRDVRFRDKLLAYTIGPIVISAMLAVPTLVVLCLGKAQNGGWREHPKFKQVTETYFWSQSFFMFLIYPTVSVMSLSGVDCRKIGLDSMLTADVSEPCPLVTGGPLLNLAIVSIILYPVGVPLFIFFILWQQKVPHLAQKKADRALVNAMINHYKLKTSSTEMEMLARFLGGHGSQQGAGGAKGERPDEQLFRSNTFKKRVGDLYDQQYGKSDKNWAVEDGGILSKVNLTGQETRDEFETKMAGVVLDLHMFTGHETIDTLSKGQAVVLIRHFEKQADDDEDDLDTVDITTLKAMIMMCARRQARRGKIVVPPLQWNESESPEERKAVRRVGNIFVAYKPEHWYYEVMNTVHKLMMTSVLVFFFQGDYTQYAMGIAIIYFFLLLTMRMQPFIISPLNNLQIYALIVLVITLFYGMMKNINDFQVSVTAPYYSSGYPFTVAVAVLCATLPIAPLVWESAMTWLHHHNWFQGDRESNQLQDIMHQSKSHPQLGKAGAGGKPGGKPGGHQTVEDVPQPPAPAAHGLPPNGNGTALAPASLGLNGHTQAAPNGIATPMTPALAKPPLGAPERGAPATPNGNGGPAAATMTPVVPGSVANGEPTPGRKLALGKLKPLPGMIPNKVGPGE